MKFKNFESKPPFMIEIKNGEYKKIFPEEFMNNPFVYVNRYGKNIKKGEKKINETGRVREDPDAVKDLPVWEKDGKKIHCVAKMINPEKGEVGLSSNPFYEYEVLEYLEQQGLPAAKPIAKIESSTKSFFLSEKIEGIRWSEKNILSEWTDEEKERIKGAIEQKMNNLKELFEKHGVIRTWKLKDMVFQIDFEKRELINLVPTDWERTKIIKNTQE